jgi:hypothetical protein
LQTRITDIKEAKKMRKIVAVIEVDDARAIAEDMGTIDYLEREFGWLEQSGIILENARVLDDDDPYDAKAIAATKTIFEEE